VGCFAQVLLLFLLSSNTYDDVLTANIEAYVRYRSCKQRYLLVVQRLQRKHGSFTSGEPAWLMPSFNKAMPNAKTKRNVVVARRKIAGSGWLPREDVS